MLPSSSGTSAGKSTSARTMDEILNDKPADGDTAALSVDDAPFLQGAEQHDGAGDRQSKAKGHPGADGPAQHVGEAHAEEGRDGNLADGAGHGDIPHRPEVLEREVQADAEHQEDDADLGQLARQRLVSDEARRVGGPVRRRRGGSRRGAIRGSVVQWRRGRTRGRGRQRWCDQRGVVRHSSVGSFPR